MSSLLGFFAYLAIALGGSVIIVALLSPILVGAFWFIGKVMDFYFRK